MGGLGWDPFFYLDFSLLKEGDPKTPLLFITGDKDAHLKPTEAAFNIFKGEGFETQLIVLEDTAHIYKHSIEDFVWNWFNTHTIEQ